MSAAMTSLCPSQGKVEQLEAHYRVSIILEWTTSLDTSSGTLFVCRGLYPAGFIAHLRLYRHIRQAAIPVLGTVLIL